MLLRMAGLLKREVSSNYSDSTKRYIVGGDLLHHLLQRRFYGFKFEKDGSTVKSMKKHLEKSDLYGNGVDIKVEHFITEEIKTPDDVLDLLYEIMGIEIRNNVRLTGESS